MPFTIFGPALSTYVRSVRLAFEEKGAAEPVRLVEVDVLKGEHRRPEFLARHPFGKVPAFEHDGFELYETDAILRYVDRVVPGPSLTPAEPKAAARMDQIMDVIDSYTYRPTVSELVIQRLVRPMLGAATDEGAIEAALPEVRRSLAAIERLKGDHPCLAGPAPSLADLLLAPIFGYLTRTPEAEGLLGPHPGLRRWWADFSARPSMARTEPVPG